MRHLHPLHSRALKVLLAAVALDLLAGIVFTLTEGVSLASGLYWAVATATTVGYGDITPHTGVGRLLAVIVMFTVIPLFAAAYSLLTSGLTSSNVSDSEERLKEHFEARLEHHLSAKPTAKNGKRIVPPPSSPHG